MTWNEEMSRKNHYRDKTLNMVRSHKNNTNDGRIKYGTGFLQKKEKEAEQAGDH